MSTVATFLGMSPFGVNEIPAEEPTKLDAARRCGELVMKLLRDNPRPSQIITRDALENAVTSIATTCGSTNAVLHLLAIAREARVPLSLDDFDHLSEKTPVFVDMKPAGRFVATDLWRAGGQALVAQRLKQAGLLKDEPHCIGRVHVCSCRSGRRNCWATSGALNDQPLKKSGGIAILRGSLAPEGCVAKLAGHERRQFKGRARCFDSEAAPHSMRLLQSKSNPAT